MNITEHRANYFHIGGIKTEARERDAGQQTVEEFIADGGKVQTIPMGLSSYLSEIEKANIQKNSKKFGRSY